MIMTTIWGKPHPEYSTTYTLIQSERRSWKRENSNRMHSLCIYEFMKRYYPGLVHCYRMFDICTRTTVLLKLSKCLIIQIDN